jgi:hypothetical protein
MSSSNQSGDLRPFLGKRRMVRIELASMPGENLHGYVVGLGKSLGLLHAFHNFFPDGYTLFRIDDVESMRSGEFEQPWDRMLESEGLLGGLDIDWNIDLDSWAAAVRDIHRIFGRITVEWHLEGDDEIAFTIGRVVDQDADSVSILGFDATGVWETDPEFIGFEDILQVHVETPYIQRFWKYLKESGEGTA